MEAIELLKRLLALRAKGQLFTDCEMVNDGENGDGENGDGEIQWNDMSTLNEELLDILDKAETLVKNYKEPEPDLDAKSHGHFESEI